MKKRNILIAILPVMICLASCTGPTAPGIDSAQGKFKGLLVMYDSTGNHALHGTISMIRDNSTNLSGKWNLENGENGTLIGSIRESSVSVNLNPDRIDANTFLVGTLAGMSIKGRWVFSGIGGPMNYGFFIATVDYRPF